LRIDISFYFAAEAKASRQLRRKRSGSEDVARIRPGRCPGAADRRALPERRKFPQAFVTIAERSSRMFVNRRVNS